MEILDDYRGPEKRDLEGFVPYVSLRNEEVEDVMLVLKEKAIEFKIKKIMGSTNNTLLVPLASTQLSHSKTLIYVKAATRDSVDEILNAYYEGEGRKHLEAAEKRAEVAKLQLKKDKEQNKWKLFNLSLLFLLIILIWAFKAFY